MEWVDENVAIGSWVDHRRHAVQKRELVDVSINARTLFEERFFSIGRRPIPEKVERMAQLMIDLVEDGAKVMVHCHHGRDRSAFLVMVYLSKRRGISYEEAFEIVRKGRPRSRYHKDWVEVMRSHRSSTGDLG